MCKFESCLGHFLTEINCSPLGLIAWKLFRLIVRPDIPAFIRYLASAFFLYYSISVSSQNFQESSFSSREVIEFNGLSGSRSDYYRNLMMQDISLPQQLPLDNVKFRMEYQVKGTLSPAGKGQVQLKVNPVCVVCDPIPYFGFNIAPAVRPDYTTLAFSLKNEFGFTEEHVVFTHVPVSKDSALYVSRMIRTDSKKLEAELSGASLIFTEDVYNTFRDTIGLLDDYFAACLLLDSAAVWALAHFPAGEGSIWGNYLQQLELQRILRYVEQSSFISYIRKVGKDPAHFEEKLEKLKRIHLRTKTILQRQVAEEIDGIDRKPLEYWAGLYFQWLTGYENIALNVNHRYSKFFAGLLDVKLDHGMLGHQYGMIRKILAKSGHDVQSPAFPYWMANVMGKKCYDEAVRRNHAGDLVKSIQYFENTLEINTLIPGNGAINELNGRINAMRSGLASSYLSLARLAAGKGSIEMADGYLDQARELWEQITPGQKTIALRESEQWIQAVYLEQARDLVAARKYARALEFLSYLQSQGMGNLKDWTEEIKELSALSWKGLYGQVLSQAYQKMRSDEPEECLALLEEAAALRRASVYRIDRDKREAEIGQWIDQQAYNEDVQEGLRYLRYNQHDIALYFLNRARILETTARVDADKNLPVYLKEASRPVVMDHIETGTARAKGYYFEECWEIISDCRRMILEFDLASDSTITGALEDLVIQLTLYQCEKFSQDYDALLGKSQVLQAEANYIKALEYVNKALGMILDDTVCHVDDHQAWYARAALEYPAEFSRRESQALAFIPRDPEAFVKSYHQLEDYYRAMDLIDTGVKFVPMHDRVMMVHDAGFLEEMLAYYYRQEDRQRTLDVIHRLWALHHLAPSGWLQKEISSWLALEDMKGSCQEPMNCLNGYVPHDKAFRKFRNIYKWTWSTGSGLKIRYLSLFLKNKSVND